MVIALAFAAALGGAATAQPPGGRSGSRLPAVGSSLPEVSVYDETGRPFSTKQLRGKDTVLVFGCLT